MDSMPLRLGLGQVSISQVWIWNFLVLHCLFWFFLVLKCSCSLLFVVDYFLFQKRSVSGHFRCVWQFFLAYFGFLLLAFEMLLLACFCCLDLGTALPFGAYVTHFGFKWATIMPSNLPSLCWWQFLWIMKMETTKRPRKMHSQSMVVVKVLVTC